MTHETLTDEALEDLLAHDLCPFCGRDPYYYVDVGVGMQKAAVVCCDLGIGLIQHGDEQLSEAATKLAQMARELLAYRRAAPAADDLRDKAEAFDSLREMLGHVANASDRKVTISQDDATGVFIVRAGKDRFWGWTLEAALRDAQERD